MNVLAMLSPTSPPLSADADPPPPHAPAAAAATPPPAAAAKLPETGPADPPIQHPPASYEPDIAPAPPARMPGARTLWAQPLSHEGALRKALYAEDLAARVMPADWFDRDDPLDDSSIVVCGVRMALPVWFDDSSAARAVEKELEKAEGRFRAARRDKTVGGEAGSATVKRRKQSSSTPLSAVPAGITAADTDDDDLNDDDHHDPDDESSGKRPRDVDSSKKSFKKAKLAAPQLPHSSKKSKHALNGVSKHSIKKKKKGHLRPSSSIKQKTSARQAEKDREAAEHKKARSAVKERMAFEKRIKVAWRTISKTDAPREARKRSNTVGTVSRQTRMAASAVAREIKKRGLKSSRMAEEAHRRARRLVRDVVLFWRKEDKERADEKRRVALEEETLRRKEAEDREEQRQKNKLKFLLGQSEAFSSFLQKKADATTAVANGDDVMDLDDITGGEAEDEIRKKAEAGAAAMAEAHRAKMKKFDTETSVNRKIADQHLKDVAPLAGKEESPLDTTPLGGPGTTDNKAQIAVKQPTILIGTMKEYQLRGLSWLVSLYDQGINGILADEMGLGKTIQTISFLSYLAETENNWGPFLVITPKATLHNWQQEITKFCPSLKVLPYWGAKNDRQELRKQWTAKRMYRKDSDFHVSVTSYDILLSDEKHFARVKWQYVVLDEAQAIKNSQSSRWKALLSFPCRNRLLLTGTPLQNKLAELWSLLHFIMPTIFDSHSEFTDWFAKDIEGHAKNNSMLDRETLARLRTLLDPFMLRRVKRDVENEMPPKTELDLPCDLTPRQKNLYNGIKSNISVAELLQTVGGKGGTVGPGEEKGQLMNLVMQLRKVCNHPETFERRNAQTPFIFEHPPPPSHVPPPPSILTAGGNSGVSTALEVTFVTRATFDYVLPRAVFEIGDDLRRTEWFSRSRLTPWGPERIAGFKSSPIGSASSSIISACRLSGIQATDPIRCLGEKNWLEQWLEVIDGRSRRKHLIEVYGDSAQSCRNMLDKHLGILSIVDRSHLRSEKILLPGHGSPPDLVEVQSRLLNAASVYIPKAAAPPICEHIPGAAGRAVRESDGDRFPYPLVPTASSTEPSSRYYEIWRDLLGWAGGKKETYPIALPHAGRLVADSGKMKALDTLLKKLKREGHKVLVYSQFTTVMDILEDYCGKSSYKYLRLDGQSALADRRDMVADWQTNDELFVFLLSTRAGGVGINLTAADTVVFYDSDWNPTVDAQAMDRAHRLGQERPVTVYRLISRGTIEERIRSRAKQKDRIHELVIRSGGEEIDAEAKEEELGDLAKLLLDEEDIGEKAKLAGAAPAGTKKSKAHKTQQKTATLK